MTHLVDTLSAEVLLFLASGPHSSDDLLAFVVTTTGDPDLEWAEVVQLLLQPLATAGMIEAVS